MSQKGIESLLGRIVTDSDFRRRFYQEPAAICMGEAMEVTTRELEAVLGLDEARIDEFSRLLDTRIVRAQVDGASPRRAKAQGTVPEPVAAPAPAVRSRQYRAR